ncbi:Beta-galactosidase [Cucumis melo var. makuwa]|uniref:Beta-galactosidase n=1 Tax=Cucumis melo var. makuwa TaxID=1194695 RepID=A0A5D3BDW8_CUCMM|nr:Beta-galactosidase [Cucumis melo var. makuwa]TYJ96851.1 Beta-galactosidase [Cucumis melo var. makuwa]
MEKLFQNLPKPSFYPTGVVSQPYALSSDQKMPHAPLLCPTVKPFRPSASSCVAYELRTATLNCKFVKSVQTDRTSKRASLRRIPNQPSCVYKDPGLNPKFDTVCGRMLEQRPLHSLMEVCFEVRMEEDRTNAMGVLTTPTIDSVAFSVRSSNHDSDKNNGKSILVCEHCKKQWHTKDQCWKLHGRPLGGKKRSSSEKQNSGCAFISETTPASTSQSTGSTASQTKTLTLGTIAQSGMPQSLGLINVDGKNPWILDSGTTNHLTGSSEHFISYVPCAGNEKIQIADDSLALIAGKGQIVPFDGFAL